MRAAAASGESFGPDYRICPRFSPDSERCRVTKRNGEASPIFYNVNLWRFIPIEAGVRISGILGRADGGKKDRADVTPHGRFPLVGYSGNGDAPEERNQSDGVPSLPSRSSLNSPCCSVRRRADIRTGTCP